MILSWTGARLEGGQYEKANVNATDNHHSTCLHYAAAAGMKSCVEVRESVSAYQTHIRMSLIFSLTDLSLLSAIGSGKDVTASKICLRVFCQFLHQEPLLCVSLLSDPSCASSLVFQDFAAF